MHIVDLPVDLVCRITSSPSRTASMDNLREFVTIKNVQCIKWCSEPVTEKERIKRRKAKQEVGEQNPEIPIIDTKVGDRNSREISDIIFVSKKCDEWMKEFSNLYKNVQKLSEQSKPIGGGYQLSWQKKALTYVAINCYETKGKIMVQGGNRDEHQLIEWLQDFRKLKQSMGDDHWADTSEYLDESDKILDEEMG